MTFASQDDFVHVQTGPAQHETPVCTGTQSQHEAASTSAGLQMHHMLLPAGDAETGLAARRESEAIQQLAAVPSGSPPHLTACLRLVQAQASFWLPHLASYCSGLGCPGAKLSVLLCFEPQSQCKTHYIPPSSFSLTPLPPPPPFWPLCRLPGLGGCDSFHGHLRPALGTSGLVDSCSCLQAVFFHPCLLSSLSPFVPVSFCPRLLSSLSSCCRACLLRL